MIRCLIAEGADTIYGYPGGAIMPVYDELYKYQDQLHHVLTRHEQGATHSAQGYARISRVFPHVAPRSPSEIYWFNYPCQRFFSSTLEDFNIHSFVEASSSFFPRVVDFS